MRQSVNVVDRSCYVIGTGHREQTSDPGAFCRLIHPALIRFKPYTSYWHPHPPGREHMLCIGIPQPPVPHANSGSLVDVLAVTLSSLLTRCPPHLGQLAAWSSAERRRLEKLLLHSLHRYSYIGISVLLTWKLRLCGNSFLCICMKLLYGTSLAVRATGGLLRY